MARPLEDLVVDFYVQLFTRFFYDPAVNAISGRRKQLIVKHALEEAASAASLSLTRFCESRLPTEEQTSGLLGALEPLPDLLDRDVVCNPNVAPETVVEEVSRRLSWKEGKAGSDLEAVFRVATHSAVQALMLVGPIYEEWRRANFSGSSD